jgi:FAD/FMN-containing dehydrogenase
MGLVAGTWLVTLSGELLMSNEAVNRESTFDPSSAGLPATIVRPGDTDYDEARRVWNGMIDRRPAMIVRCRDAGEVAATIAYARGRGLPLAVRGGGHNAAGLAVCDDGVVIDLSPMRQVVVDVEACTARVGGGATWGDVDAATQAHGLATTGGAISSTGVAGLTLGGGLGWLMRAHGLACDNLLAVEIVTADGRCLTASATEQPDLFWGVRGGGGNFGVVTSFTFQLHPVGPMVAGMLIHPLDRAVEVLRFYREASAAAVDGLALFAGLLTPPGGPPVCALVACYHGPSERAAEALGAIRAFGPPVADTVGPMSYVDVQRMMDEALPAGLPVYWRSEFIARLDDALLEELVARYAAAPSPLNILLLEQLGGAVGLVAPDATAFPHRTAAYNLAMIARWPDPSGRDAHTQWTRDLHEAVRPYAAGGVYVNYLGVGEGTDRVREAYGDANFRRLVALKDRYDPTNVFQLNQNIAPTGWEAPSLR